MSTKDPEGLLKTQAYQLDITINYLQHIAYVLSCTRRPLKNAEIQIVRNNLAILFSNDRRKPFSACNTADKRDRKARRKGGDKGVQEGAEKAKNPDEVPLFSAQDLKALAEIQAIAVGPQEEEYE